MLSISWTQAHLTKNLTGTYGLAKKFFYAKFDYKMCWVGSS